MRMPLPLTLVLALSAWAQTTAQQPAPPPPAAQQPPPRTVQVEVPAAAVLPIATLPPAAVVGTANGQKVTAGELQAFLRQMPAQMQQQAQKDRKVLVEQYALSRELAEMGRKEGLDKLSPWKEAIAYGTMMVLGQAAVSRKFEQINVTPEELKKAYEASPEKYQQARVRLIKLTFSSAPVSQADSAGKKLPTEDEAKTKAEALMKQLKDGADFVKLVKENSDDQASVAKDGEYGFVKKSDPLPNDMKTAIFSAKAGELAGPVRQPNAYYIFRIEEVNLQPFDQVQTALSNEIKNLQFRDWLSGLQKGIEVKLEEPSKPTLVTPAAPQVVAPGTAAPAAAAPKK